MTDSSSIISFSPSAISKFLDCNASAWFRYHENEIGELTIDTFYADIGNAIHNCLLEVQKYAKKKRYDKHIYFSEPLIHRGFYGCS